MNLLTFFLWWAGYAAALFYFVPNRCDLDIKDAMLPFLMSVVWPIALPASLIRKWFKEHNR